VNGQTAQPALPSALAWTAVAAAMALVFVLAAPALGAALGALLLLWALMAWSLERPELLLVGSLSAAALANLSRVSAVGGAELTVYQGVFFASLALYVWMVATGREKLQRTPADVWLLLLLAVALTALPAAQDVRTGLVAFISLVSSVLLAFLVVGVATTTARLRVALVAFLAIGATLGALALFEHFQLFALQPYYITYYDGIRARTTFEDPNVLGGVLAAATALGIPLAAAERRARRATLLWCLVGVAAVGVVMTLSRGAFLGLIAGSLVAVFIAPMRWSVRVVLVLAGIGAVLALVFVVLSPEWVASKVTGIASNDSARYRIYLAASAWRMFSAHPFGVGPGNFETAIGTYRDARVPASLLASHTTYLTILAEIGFLGLIGIAAGILVTLWGVTKAALTAVTTEIRTSASAALAGLVVLLVQSMTYGLETSKFLWFLVGASLAAAAIARAAKTKEAP
jgi:putative inorganic carbon (HCO3(-)) transporter